MKREKKISEKQKFILSLDNKRFEELSSNFQAFIKFMFNDVKDDDIIFCNKHNGTKIDYVIKVNNVKKNISFTTGKIVCIHRERINNCIIFLSSLKVSKECLLSLLSYHYADGTYDGSGEDKCYGEMLKLEYQKQVEIVNNEFNNKELLSKVIDYVLMEERSGETVDYFYHGDCRKGVFATAACVKARMLSEENNYPHKYMRIGVMNFMPLQRCHIYKENTERLKSNFILKVNIGRYI